MLVYYFYLMLTHNLLGIRYLQV
uniref:Uncharacterized protein n=1 Tax=Rhizophora mucronata TaxID=61149 RepID=A0A2P2P5E1_RHIMU